MFSPPCEQGGHWPPLLGYPRLASGAVVFAGRCVGLRLAQPLEVVAALQALGVVLAELDPCLVVALDGLLPLVAGDLVGVQIVALEPADRRAIEQPGNQPGNGEEADVFDGLPQTRHADGKPLGNVLCCVLLPSHDLPLS